MARRSKRSALGGQDVDAFDVRGLGQQLGGLGHQGGGDPAGQVLVANGVSREGVEDAEGGAIELGPKCNPGSRKRWRGSPTTTARMMSRGRRPLQAVGVDPGFEKDEPQRDAGRVRAGDEDAGVRDLLSADMPAESVRARLRPAASRAATAPAP